MNDKEMYGWFVLPAVVLAAIGALGMVWLGGLGLWATILAGVLFIAGCVVAIAARARIGQWLDAQASAIEQARESERALHRSQSVEGLDRLCVGVLPVWSGQVEMARSHSESSITALTDRFAAINQRIGVAMASSQGEGGDNLITLLRENEAELNSIVATLRSALSEMLTTQAGAPLSI